MSDIIEKFDDLPLSIIFTGDWERSTTPAPKSGSYSFGSKPGLGDSQTSSTQISVDLATEQQLSFFYWVSCENGWDYLKFYIDDVPLLAQTGQSTEWTEFTYSLPVGVHVLKWSFEKDESGSEGDNRIYIDDLTIKTPPPDYNIAGTAVVSTVPGLYESVVTIDGNITDKDFLYGSGIASFPYYSGCGIILTFPEAKNISSVIITCSRFNRDNVNTGTIEIRNANDVVLATFSDQWVTDADVPITCNFPPVLTNQIKIIHTVISTLFLYITRVQVFREPDVPAGTITPFTISADTKRIAVAPIIVNFDTSRIIALPTIPFLVNAETIRKISSPLINCKSINVKITAKTLSDTFSVQTFSAVAIDQLFTGSIKDLPYIFRADETSQTDGLTAVTGKYDMDDILNKGVHNIFIPSINAVDVRAINTMQAIVKALGKTLNINITDFYPAEFPTTPTCKDLISALFGWTDKIPQRQINVFIRGDTINVLERGKETETVEVTTYANVTVSKKKLRTLQDPLDVAGTQITGTIMGQPPRQDPPIPINYISGIFVNGDTSITYTNGLVTKEVHTVKGVEEITTSSYSNTMPPAYLTAKRTSVADGYANAAYFYDNEKLTKEIEEHYKNDKLEMKRITRDYPIGQGMWGTSIEEDDVTTYGGISQGAPGGKASAYSIANESVKPSTPEADREPPTYTVPGQPYTKYLGAMPVTDLATITRIANDIIWLDKKIEVRVTMDAYADKIFDLSKKISWQGDFYYLESNNVTVDPDKILQKLELIRWE